MLNASFLKDKIFDLFLLVIVSLLLYPLEVKSAVFNVTNEDELRDALSIAESNGEDDIINIGAGLYRTFGEPFTFRTDEDFSLTIEGQGVGVSILDGVNLSQVLLIVSDTGNFEFSVMLSGLTIENGFDAASGIIELDNGAGLSIWDAGFVHIEDCEFIENSELAGQGSGVFVGSFFEGAPNSVTLRNNDFISNTSSNIAGGAFILGGQVVFENNTFLSNTVTSTDFDFGGGGAFVVGGELSFTNNEFEDNSAGSNGGGLLADASNELLISRNVFSGNTAGRDGGGLHAQNFFEGTPYKAVIIENEFNDNFASRNGGGAYVVSGELNLSENQFIGNASGDGGGGFSGNFNSDANIVATNNIFGQNSTNGQIGGGAVFSNSGLVSLTNNTVSLNSTDMFGSALVIDNIPISTNNVINIYNNIAIENFISEGSDILVRTQPFPVPTSPPTGFPGPVTIDYGTVNLFNNDYSVFEAEKSFGCDVSEVTCVLEINEGNNIFDLPLFVNPEAADFSLLPDSPCIDAGDPDAPDVPDTDIFGNPRVPPPDMGAVEFIQAAVKGGGGCSIVSTPVTSSLAVFLVIPILILTRRIMKKHGD